MTLNHTHNRRILIVDDNEDIHDDFRRILQPRVETTELDTLEAMLLGEAPAAPKPPVFELTSAYQGTEALAKVREALENGTPYALAFIDMRMPPGWDGVETLSRIWQEDQRLQAVICSAYSDFSWESVSARFGQTDRLLILKKPFDAVEVRQMACALVEKWAHRTASHQPSRPCAGARPACEGCSRCYRMRCCASPRTAPVSSSRRPGRPLPPSRWPSRRAGKLAEVLPGDVARGLLAQVGQALGEHTAHVFACELPVGGEVRSFEARIAPIDAAEAFVLLRDVHHPRP